MADKTDLWPHTGAILCGGKSRRMGRPKAGIVLSDGRTMIERVHDVMSAVCQKVVLVGKSKDIPPALNHLTLIEDRIQGVGPLGGLEALLSSDLDSEYLITPCDLSRVVPDIYRLLTSPDVGSPAILVRQGNSHPEPLIARYDINVYPIVQDMIGENIFTMYELARRSGAFPIRIPQNLVFALHNANTPHELNDELP